MNQASSDIALGELQRWLLAHGRGFLQDAAARQRARLSSVQLALLEQQVAWRHRSRFRFPHPELWLWSDVSLAQSSDWLSSLFKAALFPKGQIVLDGCCGAGVDAVALSLRGPVIAVDSDPWLASLAQNNASAHGQEISAFAELLDSNSLRGSQWLHVDPDRRQHHSKSLKADEFSPSIDDVAKLFSGIEGGVIKVAPSTEFTRQTAQWIGESCCQAWIGSYGECRQQLLLVGEIVRQELLQQIYSSHSVAATSAKLAVVLTEDQSKIGQPLGKFHWQSFASDQVSPDIGLTLTDEVGRYVFDLHATLHASDLQQAWALNHELEAIADIRGYFTGDIAIDSSFAQCFEVIEVLPWDDRQIRKWLRGQGVGNVEIKCRLTKLDASSYQRRYSTPNGPPLTLLVTRVGTRVRAIACRRVTRA